MPQTDRDAALVRHLATRVMGWKPFVYGGFSDGSPGILDFGLDSWADAGMVWERARKSRGFVVDLLIHIYGAARKAGCTVEEEADDTFMWFLQNATPRLLCEAIGRATGFVWPQPAGERGDDVDATL